MLKINKNSLSYRGTLNKSKLVKKSPLKNKSYENLKSPQSNKQSQIQNMTQKKVNFMLYREVDKKSKSKLAEAISNYLPKRSDTQISFSTVIEGLDLFF